MEKTTFLLVAYTLSAGLWAGEEELLEKSPGLKKLVCVATAASPVHDAPKEYGCPGQGGAKFQQAPGGEPPGIRAIKNIFKKIRYELFGPVVVNRSSYAAGAGECGGHGDVSPLKLQYNPGDFDRCMAALYFDILETKPGYMPMTTIFQCKHQLCDGNRLAGIDQYLKEEKVDKIEDISSYLGCPQASVDI